MEPHSPFNPPPGNDAEDEAPTQQKRQKKEIVFTTVEHQGKQLDVVESPLTGVEDPRWVYTLAINGNGARKYCWGGGAQFVTF